MKKGRKFYDRPLEDDGSIEGHHTHTHVHAKVPLKISLVRSFTSHVSSFGGWNGAETDLPPLWVTDFVVTPR